MIKMSDKIAKKLDNYQVKIEKELIDVDIYVDKEGFSHYDISVKNITKSTSIILEKIREEFVSRVTRSSVNIDDTRVKEIKEVFKEEMLFLVKKYFPGANQATCDLLVGILIRQNVGLGDIEILLKDANIEEIAINSSKEPVRVYHKKFGWLVTNIFIPTEKKIRHYATMIASENGKEITILKPLLDAHLSTGDRVNATLHPISSNGNTMTIRKFSERPWTITDFLKDNVISYPAAALIWLAIEYELSILIAGGTGSGKTSMLNVISAFIPINQRIISIEDTRELRLPDELHWVPMESRMPNPEGKGGISMLDLVVNSLRMRPDRIIMGEVRKKEEAEVLFEAMHTGHSVYATLHANNVEETIMRLTNPPIDISKTLLPAVKLIIIQSRNRRTGKRRTFQIAEILPNGDFNLLMQYDALKDRLINVNESATVIETIQLYSGMSKEQINENLNGKIKVLKELVRDNVIDINELGKRFRKYYNKINNLI